MRVVTFPELVDLPAGTIFCSLFGGYAEDLYRKGETDWDEGAVGGKPGRGFWKTELLPQRAGDNGPSAWQTESWWPSCYHDETDVFYVLEAWDVGYLVERLTAP